MPYRPSHRAGEIYKPRLVSAVRAAGSTALAPRPVQPGAYADRGQPRSMASCRGWHGVGDRARRHGGRCNRRNAVQDRRQNGFCAGFTIAQNEKYHEKDLAERLLDHALFISFAPAEDPKLAVAVFVENGKHGGSTAAPIARKMFDAYLLPDKAPVADKIPALGKVL